MGKVINKHKRKYRGGVQVMYRNGVSEYDWESFLYRCIVCSENVIRYGDNFCSCCGRKIEWRD